MPDLGKAFVQIVPSAKGIGGAIENLLGGEAEKAGNSAGLKISAGIAGALAAGTAAAGAFAAQALKVGSGFDAAMSQVAATMGMTTAEMKEEVGTVDLAWGTFSGNLREYAQEMGANTAFSATQAAEALNYMALAGYKTQTSMEMLPNVLNLAAAGSMDLARASDMITDTQTAFGISLERTTQLVDEMAKAASTGNTSVEQLGDAFLVVGGLAAELNGGFVTLEDGTRAEVDGVQELEIALTAMANAGVKGSEAGTHMRNMLLKLADPTKDGVAAMDELGVKIFDAEGRMRSMKDIMGDLSQSMRGLKQEAKLGYISDLFNTRDIAAAEALLGAVEQDWDAIGAAILEADGAAQQMANTQLDNLQGDVTLLKSAFEGVQIAVSDQLTPSLREFTSFASEAMSKIGEAVKTGGLGAGIEELGRQLGEGISLITGYLPDMVTAGAGLVTSLVQGILDNAGNIANTAVDLVSSLAAGLGENLPTLLPAAADAVVTIATELLSEENLGKMGDAALGLLEGLAAGMTDATQTLIDALPGLIQSVANWLANDAIPDITNAGLAMIIHLTDDWDSANFQKDVEELVNRIVNWFLEFSEAFFNLGMSLARLVMSGLTMGLSEVALSQLGLDLGPTGGSGNNTPAPYIDATNLYNNAATDTVERTLSTGLKKGFEAIESSGSTRALAGTDKNFQSGLAADTETSYYIDKIEIDASSIREFEDLLTAVENSTRLKRMVTV